MAAGFILKAGEVAVRTVEKVGEAKELALKELSKGTETIQPDMETIKSQSLESIMQTNVEKIEMTSEVETPEFRPLTEEEANTIQELTYISDATLKDCTINDEGIIKLNCINESNDSFLIPLPILINSNRKMMAVTASSCFINMKNSFIQYYFIFQRSGS